MPRYYFDLRDGDDLAVDEEGMEFEIPKRCRTKLRDL
jgi:hypothetical protein